MSRRVLNIFGFVCCAALLGYAYVLQYVDELDPCPLCIFQRVAFLALGIFFILAAAHNAERIGSRVYGVLLFISGAAGVAIAWRHIWLQNLPPDQVPHCGPGLEYMLDSFPLAETLKLVLTGSGECADISWQFLGLSIPAWALVWFVLLGVGGLINNFRAKAVAN